MSNVAMKKDKTILHVVVYCVIAALGWFIPPIEPITAEGMHLLGVFIAAIYGWSVTSEVWPSFLTLILLPFTGLVNLSQFMAISWGSDTILFIVCIGCILRSYWDDWFCSRILDDEKIFERSSMAFDFHDFYGGVGFVYILW